MSSRTIGQLLAAGGSKAITELKEIKERNVTINKKQLREGKVMC